jgi:hypothetical protein
MNVGYLKLNYDSIFSLPFWKKIRRKKQLPVGYLCNGLVVKNIASRSHDNQKKTQKLCGGTGYGGCKFSIPDSPRSMCTTIFD